MDRSTWWVEHTGHRWGRMAAVPFSTLDAAVADARRSCGNAMRTDVLHVPAGSFSGAVVLSLDCNGGEIPRKAVA